MVVERLCKWGRQLWEEQVLTRVQKILRQLRRLATIHRGALQEAQRPED
jgi:hypothetical protein